MVSIPVIICPDWVIRSDAGKREEQKSEGRKGLPKWEVSNTGFIINFVSWGLLYSTFYIFAK